MPILPVNITKIAITDEARTKGVIIEYPRDMGNGELLDRINEVRASLLKSIEEAKDDKIENKDQK